MRRNRQRSLSSSGSSKSGPISSAFSSGLGSSLRGTGRRVRGSGATHPNRSAKRSYSAGRSIVWSSPAKWSSAKHTVTGWRLSGWSSSGPCGSPVRRADSKPVTCSAPHSGRSAPVSVASRNQSAATTTSPPGPRSVTASIRSPWVSAATGTCRSRTSSRLSASAGASIACRTASDTRGSCPSRDTVQAPGLSAGVMRASSVSGKWTR
jgi:hypothetical protein